MFDIIINFFDRIQKLKIIKADFFCKTTVNKIGKK